MDKKLLLNIQVENTNMWINMSWIIGEFKKPNDVELASE